MPTVFFYEGNLLPLEWSIPHTTGRRDGRQEGRECGYYHLHRDLNDALLHDFFLFEVKGKLKGS